jgi:toxin FitB
VSQPEHGLDKQIAAIALVNDLTVVPRNAADFEGTDVRLLNPFVDVE